MIKMMNKEETMWCKKTELGSYPGPETPDWWTIRSCTSPGHGRRPRSNTFLKEGEQEGFWALFWPVCTLAPLGYLHNVQKWSQPGWRVKLLSVTHTALLYVILHRLWGWGLTFSHGAGGTAAMPLLKLSALAAKSVRTDSWKSNNNNARLAILISGEFDLEILSATPTPFITCVCNANQPAKDQSDRLTLYRVPFLLS